MIFGYTWRAMTPALWALRAVNLLLILAAAWLGSRGKAVTITLPALAAISLCVADGLSTFTGRPASPKARGTMLAVSASLASMAIVVGATVGGLLVDGPGFGVLGAFALAIALLSAVIVLRFVREQPLDFEVQPLR